MPADSSGSSGAPSSTREIARATARRSPASTPVDQLRRRPSAAKPTGRTRAAARGDGRPVGRPRPGRGARHRLERIAQRAAERRAARPGRDRRRGDGAAHAREFHLLALQPPEQPAARSPARAAHRRAAPGAPARASRSASSRAVMPPNPTSPASTPCSHRRSRPARERTATPDEQQQRQALHGRRERHQRPGRCRSRRGREQVEQRRVPQEVAEHGDGATAPPRRPAAGRAGRRRAATPRTRRPSRRGRCTARGSTARSTAPGGRSPAARRRARPPKTAMK